MFSSLSLSWYLSCCIMCEDVQSFSGVEIVFQSSPLFILSQKEILLLQVHQAVLGIHGVDTQFIGINFLESLVYVASILVLNCSSLGLFICLLIQSIDSSLQVSEFSPSTSSAMGLPREFHEQCRISLELDYLKVFPRLLALYQLYSYMRSYTLRIREYF